MENVSDFKRTRGFQMYQLTTPSEAYRKSANCPPTWKPGKEAESEKSRQVNPIWLKLAARIQPKLSVSTPADPQELEADQAADRVMRILEPISVGSTPAAIQRKCAECDDEEKKPIQTKSTKSRNAEAAQDLGNAARAAGRGGKPLPEATRAFFEPRFSYDFSNVRIHTDTEGARSAEAIHSLAFTYDRDIVFGPGQFDPDSTGGRRLIAHELAHVVQQSGSGHPSVQRQPKKDSPWSDWWPPDFKPQFPGAPFNPPSTRDVAEGICKVQPSNPICKFYNINPPPSSKTVCPPSYHGSTSTTYKDQCCKDGQPESAQNCCPKENMGDGRCCVAGEVAQDGHCTKSTPAEPGKLCLPPAQLSLSGQCCDPPTVPGAWGCELKKEEPKPLLFDMFVDRFKVLFNQDQPRPGQSFESSLAGGRGDLDQAISLLKQDLSTGAQLVANASKEGEANYNLDLTDRRLAAVRAEMKDVNWKVRDPIPSTEDMSGCRGLWGAYSCGEKNADQKTMRDTDRNVIIRLFRPTELKLAPPPFFLWPPKVGK